MGVQSTRGSEEGPQSLFSGEYSRPKSLVNRDLIDSYLDPDEDVIYGLPGAGDIVHERTFERETISGEEVGVVVTDRRTLLVARQHDGWELIVLSYSQITAVSVADGLLKTRLEITTRDGEEYRLEPAATDSLTRIRGYIEIASECVTRVDQALDEARGACETLAEHLEAGRSEEADAARNTMQTAVRRAENELVEAGVDPGRSEKIETVRRDCARAVVEARRRRAQTLSAEALHKADSAAYTTAYRTYLDAREHLEVALALQIRHEFGVADDIQEEIELIDSRIECLKTWPLALAKQTRERAMKTDRLESKVSGWKATLEHYRDLLLAGWGTELEFAGKKSNIRFQLACALGNLIESRRGLARKRMTEGDHHRSAGEPDQACECYREALGQIEKAAATAREFRAGDEDAIREQRETIQTRIDADPEL